MSDPYRSTEENQSTSITPWYALIGLGKVCKVLLKFSKTLPRKFIFAVKFIFSKGFCYILAHIFFPIALIVHSLRIVGGQPKDINNACSYIARAAHYDKEYGCLYFIFYLLYGITIFMGTLILCCGMPPSN